MPLMVEWSACSTPPVHPRLVLVAVAALREPAPAAAARVRLLPRVRALVLRALRGGCEPLLAEPALVRALLRVHAAHVPGEVAFRRAREVAVRAAERPLPRVCAHVAGQRGRRLERLAAVTARVVTRAVPVLGAPVRGQVALVLVRLFAVGARVAAPACRWSTPPRMGTIRPRAAAPGESPVG